MRSLKQEQTTMICSRANFSSTDNVLGHKVFEHQTTKFLQYLAADMTIVLTICMTRVRFQVHLRQLCIRFLLQILVIGGWTGSLRFRQSQYYDQGKKNCLRQDYQTCRINLCYSFKALISLSIKNLIYVFFFRFSQFQIKTMLQLIRIRKTYLDVTRKYSKLIIFFKQIN